MEPKPTHLGPRYAAQFGDPSVVQAYSHRVPYPASVAEVLLSLTDAERPRVLEIGAGTGDLTSVCAARAAAWDAVEPSGPMQAAFRARGIPNARLLAAPVETAGLAPPYDLAVAAESLHWTDWPIALPRIRDVLAPGAPLAIVNRVRAPARWDAALGSIVSRWSTNRAYRPYDLVAELAKRGLFTERGRTATEPVLVEQTLDAFVESFHSRNGFSRDRMTQEAAESFGDDVRAAVRSAGDGDTVGIETSVEIVWGDPAPRA